MTAYQSIVTFARNVQETVTLRKELTKSRKRIAELEEWIKSEGERNDTCTFSILKRVCDECMCERSVK
jgi:hypothetical protein